jgi:thiol-disulfide isomerase/thioredoxin
MKNIIYAITAALLSFGVFFSVSYIGSYSLDYKLVIGSILYFFITFYCIKKITFYKPIITFLLIIYPLILFNLIINITDFKRSWISFPSTIFLMLSCLCGYFFYKKKNYVIPASLVLSIALWFQFGEKPFSNKMLFGSFNQTVYFKFPNCFLYDTTFNKISIQSSSKILLLDFWNSACGPCYRLFPTIDSINKLIDTNRFKIITVNIPINGQVMKNNFRLLNKFNYGFSKMFAADNTIIDSLKVAVYPTTIVIQNNNVIFRGDFLTAIQTVKAL